MGRMFITVLTRTCNKRRMIMVVVMIM